MASLEEEIDELKKQNGELAQKMQYWKMTAAQRENEKIELMKEINELRMKLSRIRSGGAAQTRKLDTALQTASKDALSHLVQASSAITQTFELVKTYLKDRQELEATSPQLNNNIMSSSEKIHRVPPLLIGGRSIQPVVSLRRVTDWTSNLSGAVTQRAVPMHMLQDVYIPLTRIDTTDLQMQNADHESEENAGDSIENRDLEDTVENIEEQPSMEEDQEFGTECRLDVVTEDEEPDEHVATPARSRTENPLEGPSWLLDVQQSRRLKCRATLEPDSTTELDESAQHASTAVATNSTEINARNDSPPAGSTATSRRNTTKEPSPQAGPSDRRSLWTNVTARRRFHVPSPPPEPLPLIHGSPAPGVSVRRRHRAASPPPLVPSPQPHGLKRVNSPVLKVVVAKMRLEGGDGAKVAAQGEVEASDASDEGASPPKRAPRFDAPSPNGATDAAVVVSESTHEESQSERNVASRSRSRHRDNSHDKSRNNSRDNNQNNSRDNSQNNNRDHSRDNSRDSASGGGDTKQSSECRTRRARKPVTYKEKPLNRKLRR